MGHTGVRVQIHSVSFLTDTFLRAFAAASSRGSSIPFFSTSDSRSRRLAFSAWPLAFRKSFSSPASPAQPFADRPGQPLQFPNRGRIAVILDSPSAQPLKPFVPTEPLPPNPSMRCPPEPIFRLQSRSRLDNAQRENALSPARCVVLSVASHIRPAHGSRKAAFAH